MADTRSGDLALRKGQGSRRARQETRRPFRVHFSLSEQEKAALQDAARRAGLAEGAFAAWVVLAHVQGDDSGPEAPDRELLRELVRAAGLVHRIGVNLNQAVKKLNATGQRPGDLLSYARESMRRVEHLDEVAERVRKSLR
jgi:hypothetical protein